MNRVAGQDLIRAGDRAIQSVIVVDDEEEVGCLLALQLEQVGVAARSVTTKEALIAALASEHPDLVLLDLCLGPTDAIEVFRLLREQHFRGSVVLASGKCGSVLEHAQRIGLRAGIAVTGILRKPFSLRELKALAAPPRTPPRPPANAGRPAPDPDPTFLPEALREGRVEFACQPKFDLRTQVLVGGELLARIRHPSHGLIPPARFLPGADPTDLYALTLEAARAAIALQSRLRGHDGRFHASVNVSGCAIQNPALLDALLDLRKSGPSEAMPLVLELTETEMINDIPAAEEFATRAALHGFRLSIDDFGSGYATFERLRTIPFHELKLERSVIDGCAGDPALRTICQTTLALAHGFGAEVVAEGVERPEDADALRDWGFDIAQGYYFSVPLPMAEFVHLARQANGPQPNSIH